MCSEGNLAACRITTPSKHSALVGIRHIAYLGDAEGWFGVREDASRCTALVSLHPQREEREWRSVAASVWVDPGAPRPRDT